VPAPSVMHSVRQSAPDCWIEQVKAPPQFWRKRSQLPALALVTLESGQLKLASLEPPPDEVPAPPPFPALASVPAPPLDIPLLPALASMPEPAAPPVEAPLEPALAVPLLPPLDAPLLPPPPEAPPLEAPALAFPALPLASLHRQGP